MTEATAQRETALAPAVGSAPRSWRQPAALTLTLLVGAVLRLWNLPAQVLVGDEVHAVRAALARPMAEILFNYQEADNCIPLTLLLRLAVDSGLRLTEWLVRLPAVLAGFATLFLVVAWAERRLGGPTAVAVAGLLAISPGLVVYSRIARSYAPATLLACVAVAAYEAWDRRGDRRLAAAYVLAATAAVWFHLGVAPLVVSPLAAGAVLAALRRGRGLLRVSLLGAITGVSLLALLAPAHRTLLPLMAMKHSELQVGRAEALEAAAWLAGTRQGWLALAFWGLVTFGFVRLARHERRLAILLGAALGGQLLGILLLAPQFHQAPVILARYLLFALPCALVAAAFALGSAWPARWRPLQPWLVGTALVGLFAAGPFTDPALARSSFANGNLDLRFTAPAPTLPAGGPLVAYRWLGKQAAGAILELPWDSVNVNGRALALYQRAHRRPVLVGTTERPLIDPRVAFRNLAAASPDQFLASRARWLVVHRSIVHEELRVGPIRLNPGLRASLDRLGATIPTTLSEAWGAPDYEDRWVVIWDLERPRLGAGRQ